MLLMNFFNSRIVLTRRFIFVAFDFAVKIAYLVCFNIITFIVVCGGDVVDATCYIRNIENVFNWLILVQEKSGLCSSHYNFKTKMKGPFIY